MKAESNYPPHGTVRPQEDFFRGATTRSGQAKLETVVIDHDQVDWVRDPTEYGGSRFRASEAARLDTTFVTECKGRPEGKQATGTARTADRRFRVRMGQP